MTDLLGTIMRGTADSTVEMRRTYRTAPQDLWEAVTSPERAARWLGELTGELNQGGHYRITFEPDDPQAVVDGQVVTCRPADELVVTWQAPGEPASQVRVTFTPVAGGTELHLVHSGLEHVSDTGHAAGWEVHLDQLAAGVHEGDWSDRWARWAELQRRYAAQLDASR